MNLKSLIVPLLFLSLASNGQLERKFIVDVLSFESFEHDPYVVENQPLFLDNGELRFFIVDVVFKNKSGEKVRVDKSTVLLEGSGFQSAPFVADSKTRKGSSFSLRPQASMYKTLVYQFPKTIVPTSLNMDKSYRVPLSAKPIDEKIYFDDSWKVIASKANAKFYRTNVWNGGTDWLIRDYYMEEGKLRMESQLLTIYPQKKEGITSFYYENGNLKETGFYVNDKKSGVFFNYHKSGELKGKVEYLSDKTVFHQCWNISGDSLLVEGSGLVREDQENGNVKVSEYSNHEINTLYEIRQLEKDTIYTIIKSQAEYSKGMKALYEFIGSKMTYPKEARRMGVQGNVYVQFIVSKRGVLEELKILKGIGFGCDVESERVLKMAKGWTPALYDGGPVKQLMVMPIIFRLSN